MSFFATWPDSWRIIRNILEREDVRILPDLWYERAEPQYHNALSEGLRDLLTVYRRAFIIERGESIALAGMVRQDDGPRTGMYRIDLTRLAEGLALTLPGCYQLEGLKRLSSGAISLPRRFMDHETGKPQPPSDGVRLLYDRVCGVIRKDCRKIRPGKRSAWVGSEGARLIAEGEAAIVDREM